MANAPKKEIAQAIVNIFETGRVLGDYGAVTLISGDSGHLTYGRSQTTLSSGNLFLLVKAYCEAPDTQLAEEMTPYLARLAHRDTSLDRDMAFRSLLRQAGDDPVMQQEQDSFFDRVYWDTARKEGERLAVTTHLGGAVIYDSYIHGSFARMRDRTTQAVGTPAQANETHWVSTYVATRRAWLAGSGQPLSKTVYRMDAFHEIIRADNWDLDLPITVLGRAITEASLTRPVRGSAEPPQLRILRLAEPRLEGQDVLELQRALGARGFVLQADGEFGPETHSAVVAFQTGEQLRADGIVGPATRAALGLG